MTFGCPIKMKISIAVLFNYAGFIRRTLHIKSQDYTDYEV